MISLDDVKSIDKIDQGFSYSSISSLADQCESAWNEVKTLSFPEENENASSIIFCGMGGSAYGGRIIKSLYLKELRIPVDVISGYNLPGFVDQNTLIIAASYSGYTEETLQCVEEALDKKAKIIGICSGGLLAALLKRELKPLYCFIPKYNPSMQPRLGAGYMQIGQLAILSSLGYIKIEDEDISKIIQDLRNQQQKLHKEIKTDSNYAKQLASIFVDKQVNIIGSEFLEGAIHSIRNPFHETSKHFANYFIVPELNHHLMEGLSYPVGLKDKMLFLIVESDLYDARIKRRLDLTREVIEKNNIATQTITLKFPTELGQTLELIQLGSYITYYLAMLHEVDPAKIPWVNYFKEKLSAKG